MGILILLAIVILISIVWKGITSFFKTGAKSDDKPKSQIDLTNEFKEVLRILNETNESIFITGKPGTGKSSLLNYFRSSTKKKHVILAPTGIAALNVSGQTIHSFFKFPPAVINADHIKPDYVRAELFSAIEMVIIDEVSMVRADLMNGIDIALRKNRNNQSEPFGGVQMVFIGDLFQLPPVITSEDREEIINTYGGGYFFDAPVLKNFEYRFFELTRIFRQSEEQIAFKNLLNNVRNNGVSFDDMVLLNSRHKDNAGLHNDGVFLTSRRDIARNINNEKLAAIQGHQFEFIGTLSGKYKNLSVDKEDNLDDKLPAPYRLKLKRNAQVIMLKNDPGRRWANGTVGQISKITDKELWVSIDSNQFLINKETWQEVEYVLNKETKKVEAIVNGQYTQYPIQLAFAMTIHKSQGKSFDKIVIDIGTGAFAHGQIYVALSRSKTLQGITLNNPIQDKDIIVDRRVIEFYNNRKIVKQTIQGPSVSIHELLTGAIEKNKSIVIRYQNFNGEVSERTLSNVRISNEHLDEGYLNEHVKGYCHLRKEEREFKISRIINIEVVE